MGVLNMVNRYGNVSDMMNSIMRPVTFWKIKVVPDSDPNADGEWIDCGTQQFPSRMSFKETASRLQEYCPKDHFIVQVSSRG